MINEERTDEMTNGEIIREEVEKRYKYLLEIKQLIEQMEKNKEVDLNTIKQKIDYLLDK